MIATQSRWFFALVLLATALALSSVPAAHAFFPPPPAGVSSGEVPPPPTDPFVPPPSIPPVVPPASNPGGVSSTPEPTTLVSGLVGLSLLAGYAIRRRFKK